MYCTSKFLFMWWKIRSSNPGSRAACVWASHTWNPPETRWLHQQEDREIQHLSSYRTRIGCQILVGERQPSSRNWGRFIPKSVAVPTNVSVRYTFNGIQDARASILSVFASDGKKHSGQTIPVGVNRAILFNITARTNTLLTMKTVCGKSRDTEWPHLSHSWSAAERGGQSFPPHLPISVKLGGHTPLTCWSLPLQWIGHCWRLSGKLYRD